MHKQIAESRNLDKQIEELIDYINTSEESSYFKEGKSLRKDHHCKWERTCMKPWIRKHDEKRYRATTKAQLRQVHLSADAEVIVNKLAKCRSWWW